MTEVSDGGVTAPKRLLSREFVVLGLSAMWFFGALGAANPVVPRFVADDLGGGNVAVGAVVGAFAVSSILLRPFWGRMGDRRGARLLMILGCALGAVGMLAHVAATSPALAFLARLPVGAGLAAVMTGATTLAVDLAPTSRQGEAASYILVAFHLGLGLGPLIGEAVLDAGSFDTVWLVLGVLMLAGAATGQALPRRVVHHDHPPGPLLHPNGIAPGIVIALGMVGFIGFSAFMPLYAEEIDLARVAPVFLLASSTTAVVRIVGGRMPDRLGPIRGGTVALTLVTMGLLLIASWRAVIGLYMGTAVLSVGVALFMPTLVPVVVAGVEEHRRSSALATFTVFLDAAIALAGPMFGLVAAVTNYSAAFAVGAGTSLVALVLLHAQLGPRVPQSLSPVGELRPAPGVDTV